MSEPNKLQKLSHSKVLSFTVFTLQYNYMAMAKENAYKHMQTSILSHIILSRYKLERYI